MTSDIAIICIIWLWHRPPHAVCRPPARAARAVHLLISVGPELKPIYKSLIVLNRWHCRRSFVIYIFHTLWTRFLLIITKTQLNCCCCTLRIVMNACLAFAWRCLQPFGFCFRIVSSNYFKKWSMELGCSRSNLYQIWSVSL